MSKLTELQERSFGPIAINDKESITATVRFDDRCGNGHNTFSVTGEIRRRGRIESCGCLHNEIAKHFPNLAPYIKWHLTSTDGPMHYIANTIYWAQEGNLEFARQSAVAPEATLEQLSDKQWLSNRLSALLEAFKRDVESLGLVY